RSVLEAIYDLSFGLISQIRHGDRIQKAVNMFRELFPDRSAYAGITYSAVLDGFILETGIGVKRRLYQSHDVADCYFRRVSRQHISAVGTSHAFHYVTLSKLLKELFKEQKRDAFSLRNRSKGHRRSVRVLGYVEYRPHRILAFS